MDVRTHNIHTHTHTTHTCTYTQRWFRAQANVDERRIVVVGHSLGGYHALRLATGLSLCLSCSLSCSLSLARALSLSLSLQDTLCAAATCDAA